MTAKNNLPFFMRFLSLTEHRLQAQEMGDMLCAIADQAVTARQGDVLEQVCETMQTLFLPSVFENAMTYYKAIASSYSDTLEAKAILNTIVECRSKLYSARAKMALGIIELQGGNHHQGRVLFLDATRSNAKGGVKDPIITTSANVIPAILQTLQGDYRWSVETLESGISYARYVRQQFPALWCNYLNNYSVNLMYLGAYEQAIRICNFTLASPYVFAYPEWLETSDEIARRGQRASHSRVYIGRRPVELEKAVDVPAIPDNVLHPDFPYFPDKSESPDESTAAGKLLIMPKINGGAEKLPVHQDFSELSRNEKEHSLTRDIFLSRLDDEDLIALKKELERIKTTKKQKSGK